MQFNGQIVTTDPDFTGGVNTGYASYESALKSLRKSYVTSYTVAAYIVTGSDGSIRIFNKDLECVEHINAHECLSIEATYHSSVVRP